MHTLKPGVGERRRSGTWGAESAYRVCHRPTPYPNDMGLGQGLAACGRREWPLGGFGACGAQTCHTHTWWTGSIKLSARLMPQEAHTPLPSPDAPAALPPSSGIGHPVTPQSHGASETRKTKFFQSIFSSLSCFPPSVHPPQKTKTIQVKSFSEKRFSNRRLGPTMAGSLWFLNLDFPEKLLFRLERRDAVTQL